MRMDHLAVFAVGRDRRGLVASLTGEQGKRNLKIENSHMATHGDHFSMMLVVSGEIGMETREFEKLLEEATSEGDEPNLTVVTRALDPDAQIHKPTLPTHVVSVFSPERPRVISTISDELRMQDINITHLHSQVLTEPYEYCVTRLFVNLLPGAEDDLEETLRRRLEEDSPSDAVDVPEHSITDDQDKPAVRVERLRDPERASDAA